MLSLQQVCRSQQHAETVAAHSRPTASLVALGSWCCVYCVPWLSDICHCSNHSFLEVRLSFYVGMVGSCLLQVKWRSSSQLE
jgi:hypothetical protein